MAFSLNQRTTLNQHQPVQLQD